MRADLGCAGKLVNGSSRRPAHPGVIIARSSRRLQQRSLVTASLELAHIVALSRNMREVVFVFPPDGGFFQDGVVFCASKQAGFIVVEWHTAYQPSRPTCPTGLTRPTSSTPVRLTAVFFVCGKFPADFFYGTIANYFCRSYLIE